MTDRPSPLQLTVPMPPPLTNASGRSRHWRAVEREKEAYWRRLDELQGAGVLPAPPPVPFARAEIRSTMRLGNAMDTDNAMARHKWAIDWLRTRGYVAEDRRDVLVWTAFPEQIVKRGQRYSLVLTLTPLPPLPGSAAAGKARARRALPRKLGGTLLRRRSFRVDPED